MMIFKQVIVNGKPLRLPTNVSLVGGLTGEGFSVPHSCLNGRCKECAVKIGGMNDQMFLGCEITPEEGFEYIFSSFEEMVLPKVQRYPIKITKLHELAEDYRLIEFKLPKNRKLQFLAGQYVNLSLAKKGWRSYSIASSPESDTLAFIVKKVCDGVFSDYWFCDAKLGDILHLEGPFGNMFLRPSEDTISLFVATGSGIAPILSMLGQAGPMHNPSIGSRALYWSVPTYEDFFDPFQYFKGLPDISFKRHLTREERPEFEFGRITEPVIDEIKNAVKLKSLVNVYACGAPALIEELHTELDIFGPEVKLFADAFLTSGE